jgi:hypothetical protein
MMTIVASQYPNPRRPCRSSAGHGAARPDAQCGPQRKRLLSINAPPLRRNDPLSHRIGADQSAGATCQNARTASVPIKSP